MKEIITELKVWLEQLENFTLPNWDSLPDLDLYMDQVITYLEKQLSPLTVEEHEKLITPFMINNYVKGNLIPSPIKKKYSREHMGFILGICSVKQVLSISDISKLRSRIKSDNIEDLYQIFIKNWQDNLHHIAFTSKQESDEIDEDTKELLINRLNYLALKLAIEAEAQKIIATKIIYLLNKSYDEDLEKKKKKK
jgi:hypothetical protein